MTYATRRGRLNPRGTSMGMRDDTAERAHDSAEDCIDETTAETQVSSEARMDLNPRPYTDHSNGAHAHALEGVAQELDSLRFRVESTEATLRTQTLYIRYFAVFVTPIQCALCWYAHNTNSNLWDKVNVGIFACTAWLFPSFYCHVFQEWIFTDHAPRFVQRFRIMGHMDFFGLPATNWSRALSCFCVNTFLANFLYLLSALHVASQRDIYTLRCVGGIHLTFWCGLNTMHRMIPRPDVVFDLMNRLLRGQHAQNFIILMMIVVIPSIFKLVLENWDALISERDEYTVAFAAVFCVDGMYYTLSLFNTDDPMWALTRQRGRISVEVFNLQSLMMAMLAKFVWVVSTLFLSDRAKQMWISVELVVQIVSLIAVSWVSHRYVPDQASLSIRSHSRDIGAKVVVLCSLCYAARGDVLRILHFMIKTVVYTFLFNEFLNRVCRS